MMTAPMSEDGGPLREWAPLTNFLQQIPVKLQCGIFTQDLSFTCIDALPEFIAVGTNCGLVYWYDRETGDLQRLRCENAYASITCLKVISTVDYMVAAGNNQGVVTVFQIPKSVPESLPDSLKPKQKKQVERYNIGGLHKSPVSAVEWSKNGMKLFSGDQDGLVVLTEIDFYMHLSKSSELLNEKYAVVQLNHQQGLLLVSTIFRTILVDRNQNNKVSQVGQKERKVLAKLGAVFASRQTPIQDPVIYASRPGIRLWQADKNGTVIKTLIFKEAVQTENTQVALLNPAPDALKRQQGSSGEPSSFGVLLPFYDNLLVTYSEDVIYVVNPVTISISSVVGDVRKITGVACTKDEIFVLEGERNIIRIANHPDEHHQKPPSSEHQVIAAGIQRLLMPSNIIQAIRPSHSCPDPAVVTTAEEAFSAIESARRREIFQKISEQEFEDVVFTPEKKNKKVTTSNNKPSFGGGVHETHSSLLTLSTNKERNLESLQKDVENKEKLLANVLKFDLSEYMTNSLSTITYVNCTEPTSILVESTAEDSDSAEDVSYRTELKKLETLGKLNNDNEDSTDDVLRKIDTSQELEMQFNVLSREFASSAIFDIEAADWVVI